MKNVSNNQTNKKAILFRILLSLPSAIAFILSLLLLIAPSSMYKGIHFGWYIAIIDVCAISAIVLSSLLLKPKRHRAILICIAILAIAIMAVSMFTVDKRNFEISDLDDFKLIDNVPLSGCHFEITNDIDAMGQSLYIDRYQRINGNGHVIRNANNTFKVSYYDLWTNDLKYFPIGNWTIRNLAFENCNLTFNMVESGRWTRYIGGTISIVTGDNKTLLTIDDSSLLSSGFLVKFNENGEISAVATE